MDALTTAIEALQRAREAKLAELEAIERALESLGMSSGGHGRGTRKDYEDLGVTAAAKKFLREKAPEPQDTRTIADALINRGLKTQSKNFVATVYATLNNSSAFRRSDDGRWELEELIT